MFNADPIKRLRNAVPLLVFVLAAGAASAADEPASEVGPERVQSAEKAPLDDRELLIERANAYWEARVQRSPEVYEFYPPKDKLPPGVKGTPAEGGAMSFLAYQVEEVYIEGEEAYVQLKVETALPAEQMMKIPDQFRKFLRPTIAERWIKLEGVWYKRPVEMGLSRMMRRRATSKPEVVPSSVPQAEAADVASGEPAPAP